MHKELLQQAKNNGVEINIGSTMNKDLIEELTTMNFCNIKRTKSAESHLFSVDGKECLIIEPIPDDENILYGRDLGIWVSSASFTRFLEDFFISNFKKARHFFNEKV